MWICFLAAWGAPSEHTVEAKGRGEIVVDLPSFGRYAFEVTSEVGTALQLVDRMEGPGNRVGVVGEKDGRIDTFLDKGQAKVFTYAPLDGRGNANVLVTPFEAVGSTPELKRNEPVLTELEDKQARGYWVDTSGDVAFEVVGRYLGDVRLWRDGTWLVGATPRCGVVDPVEGQPLQRCVLTAKLEEGLYQLVAYGGPGDDWANDAPDSFLSVRWDAPTLPAVGQRVARIGPTGMDFFRIDGRPDTAHLTLPEIAPASLEIRGWTATSVFDAVRRGAEITDESRTPETTASTSSGGSNDRVIAIKGTPGQRYTLQWFDQKGSPGYISGSGETLVTTFTTARPSDDIMPTGIFYRVLPGPDREILLAKNVGIDLDAGAKFEQRFNLLDAVRFFVKLDEDADVKFSITEGDAALTFERFFVTKPKDWKSPPGRKNEWADFHKAGTYVLTVRPNKKGIVTLNGQRNSWSDLANSTVGNATKTLPIRPGIATKIDLDPGASVSFARFHAPGSVNGFDVRDLPLDPRNPVALPLAPRETFVVPVRVAGPTKLRATLPNGELLPLGGFGPQSTELNLPGGSAAVQVINDTDKPVIAVFGAVIPPPAPKPLPPGKLEALPDFPKLSFTKGHYTDLDRNETETLQLEVGSDGLYQLESTGLLATRGTLRSRIALDLGTSDQSGVGRNFRVARYLRSGTYQVTVGTRGQTRGHLGVELKSAPIQDGGQLQDGDLARATLQPFEGIQYRFDVAEAGNYRLSSKGQTQTFNCRLEDDEGWPIVKPNRSCDQTVTLQPGSYVLKSLPSSVSTKRRTFVKRQVPGEVREGHGPFTLALGTTAYHTWTEPPGDGDRPEDTWTFTLPATIHVTLDPGDEMAGTLLRDGEALARLSPSRTWKGELEAGEYTVKLQAARRGTGIPYSLRLSTREMTVGQHRTVSGSSTLSLVVGEPGLVTVYSDGGTDVRARLLDPDGEVVAANDDRPDDWNFRVSEWMQPGTWRLEIETVGRNSGSTTVHVEAPEETPGGELKVGGKPHALKVGKGTTVYPLKVGPTKEAIVAVATASQNVGVGLEQKTPDGWRSLGTAVGTEAALLGRRTPGHEVRLRLWSLDGREGDVSLKLDASNPRSPATDALKRGYATNKGGWFALDGKGVSAGLYRVKGDRTGLKVCAHLGQPCHPAGGVVALNKRSVLFGRRVQLERTDLAGEPVPVELDGRPKAIETGLSGLVAMEIRSASGFAVARLGDDSATAVSAEGALALGTGTSEVWGDGVGRVRAVALKQERTPWNREEAWSGEIPARTAFLLPIDKSAAAYTVSLERGLVLRSGEVAVWADRDAVRASVNGSGTLVLANPTDAPAMARVAPPTPTVAPVVSGQPHEVFASRAGLEVLDIGPGEGQLHAAGAELAYLRSDGVLERGTSLDIGPGGRAWVQHTTGWYAVWSDAGGPGPWPSGAQESISAKPGVTHIEADRPYAVLVDVDGQRRVEWRPEGGAVDVLAKSAGTLKIRALGAGTVEPEVQTQAVADIEEGLGPEVLLDAGGSAWFRFQLAEDGPVGIGVRAGADRVTATLVRPDGTEVVRGVVRKAELTAGTWYLRLSQPADAAPVRARPAVAGIDRPDDGPPESVVRSYLKKAGLQPGGAQ